MPGVYGEFLAFFSELFEEFEVYRQSPDIVSGYALMPTRKIIGIRQTNDRKMSGWGPRNLSVLNPESSFMLWTYEPIDMANEFVKIDGKMHRPVKDSAFVREGGFYETVLDMVSGNDGTNEQTPELAKGRF